MMRDYMPEGDVPQGAKPVKIMANPQTAGKIGVLVESDEWVGHAEQLVDFRLKRFHAVTGE
jgi:hypothetical protein